VDWERDGVRDSIQLTFEVRRAKTFFWLYVVPLTAVVIGAVSLSTKPPAPAPHLIPYTVLVGAIDVGWALYLAQFGSAVTYMEDPEGGASLVLTGLWGQRQRAPLDDLVHMTFWVVEGRVLTRARVAFWTPNLTILLQRHELNLPRSAMVSGGASSAPPLEQVWLDQATTISERRLGRQPANSVSLEEVQSVRNIWMPSSFPKPIAGDTFSLRFYCQLYCTMATIAIGALVFWFSSATN
jgi:hypothetical protein